MKILTAIALALVLTGCVTYPQQYSQQQTTLPQYRDPDPPQRNISVGGGVNSDGKAAGWFQTILRIGNCALMPYGSVNGNGKANGNAAVTCN